MAKKFKKIWLGHDYDGYLKSPYYVNKKDKLYVAVALIKNKLSKSGTIINSLVLCKLVDVQIQHLEEKTKALNTVVVDLDSKILKMQKELVSRELLFKIVHLEVEKEVKRSLNSLYGTKGNQESVTDGKNDIKQPLKFKDSKSKEKALKDIADNAKYLIKLTTHTSKSHSSTIEKTIDILGELIQVIKSIEPEDTKNGKN